MRWWTKLMIPVLMLGLVSVADAKGAKKHAHKGLKGTIMSISGTDLIVAPHHKKKGATNAAETTKTIHTTAQTAITIGGVGNKLITDLAPGEKVRITETGDTASTITATAKHHHLTAKHHHKKKK